jgi:hypothetical protein
VSYINIKTFDNKTLPNCEVCCIKHLCGGLCLGSQFETTGDLFNPIPTACRMEHYKITGLLKGFRNTNTLSMFYNIVQENKKVNIKLIEEEFLKCNYQNC